MTGQSTIEPNGPLLAVEELQVTFSSRARKVEAVRNVSLELRAGECLAIVGESGSGKSVTARALLGLCGPSSEVRAQRLEIQGSEMRRATAEQWREVRGRKIGLAFQDASTSLDPLRRVGDEVAEPLQIHRIVPRSLQSKRVSKLLEEAGIPDPSLRARQFPHQLSGGLRQRALIASALAADPMIIVADEPTTALDTTIQAQVLELLATKRDEGAGLIFISHDLAVVASIADRIVIMHAGAIVEEGPTSRVLSRRAHPYTVELIAAIPTLERKGMRLSTRGSGPGRVVTTGCRYQELCPLVEDLCRQEEPVLVPLSKLQSAEHTPISGDEHLVRCWRAGQATVPQLRQDSGRERSLSKAPLEPAPVLEFEGVTKKFPNPGGGMRTAVDEISFEVLPGEALGIVGESGAGKSTLAALALALTEPDAGTVRLSGEIWSHRSERSRRSMRRQIQLVPQDPLSSFDPRFTVEQVVGEALEPGRRGVRRNRRQITDLLERVDLGPQIMRRSVRELSGGQRQRVAIARALAPEPSLIICDEPVSALDVCVQAQILDLFGDLHADLGTTLMVISHDISVIHHICDRVLVFKDGRIVEDGPVDHVLVAPQHPYTRSLIAAVPSPVLSEPPSGYHSIPARTSQPSNSFP